MSDPATTISVLWGDDDFIPECVTKYRRHKGAVDYIVKSRYDELVNELTCLHDAHRALINRISATYD